MITARVKIAGSWHHDINAWCLEHIGKEAIELDEVDDHRPWIELYQLGSTSTIYCFAREEDALMFALCWGGSNQLTYC